MIHRHALFFAFLVAVALLFQGASAASATYSSLCDSVFCRIVEDSITEIAPLKATIDEGSCVPQFGQKAEQICNTALERFSQEAPLPDDDKKNEALYDKKVTHRPPSTRRCACPCLCSCSCAFVLLCTLSGWRTLPTLRAGAHHAAGCPPS